MKLRCAIVATMTVTLSCLPACVGFIPSPAASVQSACQEVSVGLCRGMDSNVIYRVAIKDFEDPAGNGRTVARALNEHLKGLLSSRNNLIVVEDPSMDAVLREVKAQDEIRSSLDPATLVDIEHKLVGIDAIIFGTLIDYGSEWGVECRLMPLSRGTVAGHGYSRIPKAPFQPRPSFLSDLGSTCLGFTTYEYRHSSSYSSSGPGQSYSSGYSTYQRGMDMPHHSRSSVVIPAAPSARELQNLLPQ